MRKLFASLMVVALVMVQNVSAVTIEEVVLEDELNINGKKLYIVGAGVRTKFFMDLYVGSLYAEKGEGSADSVMNGVGTALIRLDIISSMITSEKMESATREGFENATGGDVVQIQEQIEAFINVFKEEIKVDDTFVFEANGGKVRIVKNGTEALVIDSPEFRAALYGIWLSEEPADEDLKEAMLSQE